MDFDSTYNLLCPDLAGIDLEFGCFGSTYNSIWLKIDTTLVSIEILVSIAALVWIDLDTQMAACIQHLLSHSIWLMSR